MCMRCLLFMLLNATQFNIVISHFLVVDFTFLFLLKNSFEHDSIRHNQDDSLEEGGGSFTNYFTECKKEAITPPNSINNNNNEGDGSPALLQLKTEPVGNPSSPETTSVDIPPQASLAANSADECAGCGRLIQVWMNEWMKWMEASKDFNWFILF